MGGTEKEKESEFKVAEVKAARVLTRPERDGLEEELLRVGKTYNCKIVLPPDPA